MEKKSLLYKSHIYHPTGLRWELQNSFKKIFQTKFQKNSPRKNMNDEKKNPL